MRNIPTLIVIAALACVSLALAYIAFGPSAADRSPAAPSAVSGAGEAKPALSPHMQGKSMLVFSETREWRHNEGIAGAGKALADLATAMDYKLFSTEHSGIFNAEDLSRFDLVVFNNTTGIALTAKEQAAFETWFASGGALVAIHGSGDSSDRQWDWYAKSVIGPRFTAHPADPQFQSARVETLRPGHPVMAGIPQSFTHTEEWYSFDSLAQAHGMTPLAGLDEKTYRPRNDVYGDYQDLRMDPDGQGPIAHPIIWSKCHTNSAGPRSVYIALGHQAGVFDEATSAGVPRRILSNALHWTVKNTDATGEGCAP